MLTWYISLSKREELFEEDIFRILDGMIFSESLFKQHAEIVCKFFKKYILSRGKKDQMGLNGR